jgi:hypothetical protein
MKPQKNNIPKVPTNFMLNLTKCQALNLSFQDFSATSSLTGLRYVRAPEARDSRKDPGHQFSKDSESELQSVNDLLGLKINSPSRNSSFTNPYNKLTFKMQVPAKPING